MCIKHRLLACALSLAMAATMFMPTNIVAATSIGQGSLGGLPSGGTASASRYNTTDLQFAEDPSNPDSPTDEIAGEEKLGDTRTTNLESTRRMYEYYSDGTLIIHGYNSIVGPIGAIDDKYVTPGTIGGSVIGGNYRKSWLDGFKPYIYDGRYNPDTTGTAITAASIKYILIDDVTTRIEEVNIGNTEERVHDSYDMEETEYISGITTIEPYTFANLPCLEAIDFDSSQIQEIGEYAFANCPLLGEGSGAMQGFTKTITYSNDTTGGTGASYNGSQTRTITSHAYPCTSSTCDGSCRNNANSGENQYYQLEKTGRIILPHNLITLGEHAFQNCPKITEYAIHKDNQRFIASMNEIDWSKYTAGVIYSNGSANKTAINETGYMKLRAAVMSDYQNTPEQYKRFWIGPFGEREPQTLEWYVKSWNAKEKSGSSSIPEHYNWTEIERAKAKAIVANGGHTGTGTSVTAASDTGWESYLPANQDDYELVEADPWWTDDFYIGRNINYNRADYSNSIQKAGESFDKAMKGKVGTNFNTLYLYPEGKGDFFRIFPGHKPSDYDPYDSTLSKTPVKVIAPFAFSNAKNLTQIDMSPCNELTTFGQGTFMNCTALTTVIFPEAGCTIDRVSSSTTDDPGGGTPNYELKKLSDDMFSQCLHLNKIYNLDRDIGKTANLGSAKYSNYEHGTNYSTVQEFGENCFHKCLNINGNSFVSGSYLVIKLGSGLPDSLLIIGQSCFHTCKKLTMLHIHNNVEIIGDYAFSDCYNLNDLTFEEKSSPPSDNGPCDRITDTRNHTSENKQLQFYISGEFSEIDEKKALQLGDKVFEHCTDLDSIIMGSNWIIRPTSFEHARYLCTIERQPTNTLYKIYGYTFDTGNSGQNGSNPDRASGNDKVDVTSSPFHLKKYFGDCAYGKGLKVQGTQLVKND